MGSIPTRFRPPDSCRGRGAGGFSASETFPPSPGGQWLPQPGFVFRRNILRAAKAVSAKSLNTPSIPSS